MVRVPPLLKFCLGRTVSSVLSLPTLATPPSMWNFARKYRLSCATFGPDRTRWWFSPRSGDRKYWSCWRFETFLNASPFPLPFYLSIASLLFASLFDPSFHFPYFPFFPSLSFLLSHLLPSFLSLPVFPLLFPLFFPCRSSLPTAPVLSQSSSSSTSNFSVLLLFVLLPLHYPIYLYGWLR